MGLVGLGLSGTGPSTPSLSWWNQRPSLHQSMEHVHVVAMIPVTGGSSSKNVSQGAVQGRCLEVALKVFWSGAITCENSVQDGEGECPEASAHRCAEAWIHARVCLCRSRNAMEVQRWMEEKLVNGSRSLRGEVSQQHGFTKTRVPQVGMERGTHGGSSCQDEIRSKNAPNYRSRASPKGWAPKGGGGGPKFRVFFPFLATKFPRAATIRHGECRRARSGPHHRFSNQTL